MLEEVASQKRQEQLAQGKIRAQQLGISTSEAAFTTLSEIFGCADGL